VKLITGIGTIAVVAVGAYDVLNDKMKVGDLWMIVAYIGMIYKPLEAMSYTLGSVQNNVTNLKMARSCSTSSRRSRTSRARRN
jgi:ATP-binding cassette subfamily B protein/subfamily B ATP-binding cassette protein MsbA